MMVVMLLKTYFQKQVVVEKQNIQTLIQFSHTLSRGLLPGLVAVTHDHRNKPMTVDIIALRACTCASVALSILAEASLPELGAR